MTTREIFKRMLDWIYANRLASNQTEVGRQAGINEVHVSRILNGYVKRVKLETLWRVNTAYGNVFNPEWLRGESDVMLIADLASDKETVGTSMHDADSPTPPDRITAALLAAKDETIAALRAQLADTTAAKDEVIATKDALIDTLRQQIITLRAQLTIEKGLSESGGSFLSELVERPSHHRQTT